MSAQPQVTTARIADWLWSQDLGYTIDDDRNIVLRFEAFTIYIFVGAEFSDLLPVRGYWRPELADTDLERVDAHIRQYTLGGVVVKLGISRRAAPPPRHLFALPQYGGIRDRGSAAGGGGGAPRLGPTAGGPLMAWWTDPDNAATPPVTMDRVAAWLERIGWEYERRRGGDYDEIHTGAGRTQFLIEIPDPRLLSVRGRETYGTGHGPGAQERVAAAATQVNESCWVPSVFALPSQGDATTVATRALVNIEAGANDEQLHDYLGLMTTTTVERFKALRELLGIDDEEEAG